jgi:vacuolar-type H+-ATPase subunit H
MTGKILDEILNAEKEAADIKKQALLTAEQTLANAKMNGEALCRETKQRAESKKKDLAAHSVRLTNEALEKTRAEAENQALIVCAAASANIPDAVNFIIGKVGSIWQ